MILPKAEPSQPRTLPAEAVTGTGGVFVSQTGQMDIDSVDAFTGDVELTASAAIADAAAAKDANVDVTGASVTLAAGTTVGASDNLLDIEIATLAGGTTTGGFYIDEMDAITIDGVDTGSSEFNLTAGGAVTLNDAAVTTAGNVSITAVGGAIEASDDDDADILADGNVSLTGDGIGAAAATIIIAEHDGTDTNDASLTLNNTGVSAETIDVEVLSNAFNAVSITLADADSTADIAFAGTDVIDIDST